jgi:hypothetical protein
LRAERDVRAVRFEERKVSEATTERRAEHLRVKYDGAIEIGFTPSTIVEIPSVNEPSIIVGRRLRSGSGC